MQSRNEITHTLNASLLAPVSLRTCFMTNGRLSNYFIPRIRFSGMLRVVGSNLVTEVSEQHRLLLQVSSSPRRIILELLRRAIN